MGCLPSSGRESNVLATSNILKRQENVSKASKCTENSLSLVKTNCVDHCTRSEVVEKILRDRPVGINDVIESVADTVALAFAQTLDFRDEIGHGHGGWELGRIDRLGLAFGSQFLSFGIGVRMPTFVWVFAL